MPARFSGYIAKRLPPLSNILSVYAVIVFFVYSWTLLVSFYRFPSWILYLTIGQILTIYAYNFSTNFLESVFVLAAILLLDWTVFFPLKEKNEFRARSIAVTVFLLASAMGRLLLFQDYENASAFVEGELWWWGITILAALPGAALLSKIHLIRSALENFAERVIIFLYIYLPISFIALLAVGIRNLF